MKNQFISLAVIVILLSVFLSGCNKNISIDVDRSNRIQIIDYNLIYEKELSVEISEPESHRAPLTGFLLLY